LDSIISKDEISIGVDVFSPDNDGQNDLLEIHYRFPQSGTMLSLNVFDCNGQPVRKILNGETVSNEGTICWDGLKDNRTIAASGIYIIMAKSFDLIGNSKVVKQICFLTRRY
jgi:flagellar hook assembly protein FlgD